MAAFTDDDVLWFGLAVCEVRPVWRDGLPGGGREVGPSRTPSLPHVEPR